VAAGRESAVQSGRWRVERDAVSRPKAHEKQRFCNMLTPKIQPSGCETANASSVND
jgi:hypothetical protein